MEFKSLDIGCGFSKEVVLSKKYKAHPRGDVNIDIGAPEVKILNFIRASALKLPFKEEVFEIVYIFHLLEHVGRAEKVVTEILRVLKTGGKVVAETPNRMSKASWEDHTHKHHFTNTTFGQLFKQFNTVKTFGAGGCWIPLKGNTKLWGRVLCKISPFFAKNIRVIAYKSK